MNWFQGHSIKINSFICILIQFVVENMHVTKIELWILTLCLESSKLLVLQTVKTQLNAVCIVAKTQSSSRERNTIFVYIIACVSQYIQETGRLNEQYQTPWKIPLVFKRLKVKCLMPSAQLSYSGVSYFRQECSFANWTFPPFFHLC